MPLMQKSFYRYILLILLLQGWACVLRAQGLHFSQAYSAHLTLNPANTGRYNGDMRAVGLFRQQGHQLGNDYRTAYLSFEKPFYYKEERIDAGLYYSRDNSAGSTFPADRLNLSGGHGLRIGEKSHLHAGLQVAAVYRQINWSDTSFPDQYNRGTGGFDPGLPTGEQLDNNRSFWLDAGLGLVYGYQMKRGLLLAGYSLQQINRPDETLFGESYRLPMKHIWHAKADIDLGHRLFAIPAAFLLKTGEARLSLLGANLGYQLEPWLNQHNSLLAGLHIRQADFSEARSLIFSLGGSWQYWTLLVAYDTDISRSRHNSISASGIEMSLSWVLPGTPITQRNIQWERY